MKRKAVEIIITILCYSVIALALALAARYFAEQTVADKKAMEAFTAEDFGDSLVIDCNDAMFIMYSATYTSTSPTSTEPDLVVVMPEIDWEEEYKKIPKHWCNDCRMGTNDGQDWEEHQKTENHKRLIKVKNRWFQ